MVARKTPRAEPPRAPDYRVRGVIVNFGDTLSPRQRAAALRTLRKDVAELGAVVDARALRRARPLGAGAADLLIPLPAAATDVRAAWTIVHALRRHALVADAEPAVRIDSGLVPPPPRRFGIDGAEPPPLPQARDPRWSVDNARISGSWAQTRGSGIVVGHPDTGYTHHPQIDNARLLTADGYDFEDDRADPLDPLGGSFPGHGTATASVIIANATPSPGVYGAAPDARLVPYRVSDSVVHFDFTNLTQALYRARERRCDLVSMSLGGPWAGRALSRAVDALVADDIVLLAAAGNVWPWVVYPAKFDNVVAVAASNALDRPWKDSAHGDAVDIAAPGESVWRAYTQRSATVAGVDYSVAPSSGTSYAVATSAGACALWLARHGATALRRRYRGRLVGVFLQLLKTAGFRAVPRWDTGDYGAGILDATALLAAPLPAQAPALTSRIRQAVAPSQRAYAWARLQPFFPELAPHELAHAIVPAFGARAGAAARRLADVIDEVEFFVATDPAVRQSVLAAAQPRPRGRGVVAVPDPRSTLRGVGSAQLLARLRD